MDLSKMALITAIIGLIVLALLSIELEAKPVRVSQISEDNLGEYVKITGDVVKVKDGSVTQFDLRDDDEIRVISFKKLNVLVGERLEVIGKVDEYKGFLEINAEKITRLAKSRPS